MSSQEIRTRIRTLIDERKAAGRFTPAVDCWLRAVDADFSKALGDAGLLGMTWPEEYGGQARPNTDRLALSEELLRAGAPVALHWIAERQIGPAVLRDGTEALKAEALPSIIAGTSVIGLGMSEPESGSDLASVRTRAVPVDGDGEANGWRLTGRKVWTTQAHNADRLYVLARTSEEERKHEGLSEFLIDMDSPGVSVSPIVDLTGEHHFNEVTFEDVFIPADRLIGELGQGWKQVVEQLSFERGGPERALSTWVLLTAAFDEAGLRDDEGALRELGEITADLAALREMFAQIASALDDGQAPVRHAAASKFLGNRFEKALIDRVRRLVPAPSESLAALIQTALSAAPAFGIRGGASDVLLSIVSKMELPKDLSTATPLPALPDGEHEELVRLAAQVAGGSALDVDRSQAGQEQLTTQVADLGWTQVSVAETAGGEGGSLADAAVLVRGLARTGAEAGLTSALVAAHEQAGSPVLPTAELSAVLDAATLVGAAEGALALTIEHVIAREQFGAPLARIPAVAAHIARMRLEVDLAAAGLARALRLAEPDGEGSEADPRAAAAALAAKATACQAGGAVAEGSHQLHGAIGITAEHPLHHLTQLIWRRRESGMSEHACLIALGERAKAGEAVIFDDLTSRD